MEDRELIHAARQGDLHAFNELTFKYQDLVFHHACRMLDDRDIAEDVTQDAFLLAFQKIYQFRDGSFRAWLLKIVTNLCCSEMRNWRRHPTDALEPLDKYGNANESPYWLQDPKPNPEDVLEGNELRHRLEDALNKLSAIHGTIISLIDIQQLNYQEAASVMGISIGTVKSRLARGRMQFRTILKNMESESMLEKRSVYYGTIPGHCQAGQAGKSIVGSSE